MSRVSPGGPMRVVLLNAQTADETLGTYADCKGCPGIVIYVIGTGTTSSGVITIEEAEWDPPSSNYGGTWSPITTVNASDVTGGLQKAIHLPLGEYAYVRTRISTAIGGGGSVTTVLRAS